MLAYSAALACGLAAGRAIAAEAQQADQWQARGSKSAATKRSAPVEAAQAPAIASSRSGSLSWRAQGTRPAAPIDSDSDFDSDSAASEPAAAPLPKSESFERVAPQKIALAPDAHVRKVADADEALVKPKETKPRGRRLPAVTSRSRIRDAVMQVSNEQPSELKDPFDSAPADSAEPAPADDISEPAAGAPRPSDLPEPSRPELRNDRDPFSDDEMPAALPDEPAPDRSAPSDEPYTGDPSLPGPDPTIPDIESPATTRADQSCDEEKRECLTAIEELRGRDIKKIFVGLQITGDAGQPAIEGRDFPCECALGLRTSFQGRDWSPTTFSWKATAQYHKPLYFEDVALERYGHSWNPVVQPFMSAAHFFGSVPLLPYKMGLTPPQECMYTLGYYRPGNCAPYMLDPIPLSLRAGAFQALGVTGFVFWFWPPVSGLGSVP